MSLAQRLDDLALSHSKGLLDDDEYRILRQELFNTMASESTIPTEAHIVPTRVEVDAEQSIRTRRRVSRFCETVTTQPPPVEAEIHTSKSPIPFPSVIPTATLSVISGLWNRARHHHHHRHQRSRSSSASSDLNDVDESSSASPKLTSKLVPRFLVGTQRAGTGTGAAHTGSFRRPMTPCSLSSSRSPCSPTPSHRAFSRSSKKHPRLRKDNTAVFPEIDIFEDGDFHTVRDLRRAIEETQSEAQRLSDAFRAVENGLRDRGRDHSDSRSNVWPLSDNGETLPRGHGRGYSPQFDRRHHASPTLRTHSSLSDLLSRPSTSLSQSQVAISDGNIVSKMPAASSPSPISFPPTSNGSLRQPPSHSRPRLFRFHSSWSLRSGQADSQAQSQHPPQSESEFGPHSLRGLRHDQHQHQNQHQQRPMLLKGKHQAECLDHLPLRPEQSQKMDKLPRKAQGIQKKHTIFGGPALGQMANAAATDAIAIASGKDREVGREVDQLGLLGLEPDAAEQLSEMHRRRLEVEARYEARLEYLRARLKGAELHERVMRK